MGVFLGDNLIGIDNGFATLRGTRVPVKRLAERAAHRMALNAAVGWLSARQLASNASGASSADSSSSASSHELLAEEVRGAARRGAHYALLLNELKRVRRKHLRTHAWDVVIRRPLACIYGICAKGAYGYARYLLWLYAALIWAKHLGYLDPSFTLYNAIPFLSMSRDVGSGSGSGSGGTTASMSNENDVPVDGVQL